MSDSINPHRLYKNPDKGIITGVCAGIADYFDVSRAMVRVLYVVLFLFFSLFMLMAYIVLSILLKPTPKKVFHTREEETFWRGVSTDPKQTLGELKHKFRTINEKLERMETKVTSREFELEEQYRDL